MYQNHECDQKYIRWITNKLAEGNPHMECKTWSEEMCKAFPELRCVRGHIYLKRGSTERPHWWCVTPGGTIVDPTAKQFAEGMYVGSGGIKEYIELNEEQGEPTSKCMNCGAWCYEPWYNACCGHCATELEVYYNQKLGNFHPKEEKPKLPDPEEINTPEDWWLLLINHKDELASTVSRDKFSLRSSLLKAIEQEDSWTAADILSEAFFLASDDQMIRMRPAWNILCDLCSESGVLFEDEPELECVSG